MMKNISVTTVMVFGSLVAFCQATADTVVIPLARTSKIIFTVQDRSDLDLLRHYNFQNLFNDVLNKLDSANEDDVLPSLVTHEPEEVWSNPEVHMEEHNDDDENDEDWERDHRVGRTWQSWNMDLGINNYLENGQFPTDDKLYTVKPWGSWYVGLNSLQRTRVGKHVFFEWGLGVSWYTFKFEQEDVMIIDKEEGIDFVTDTRDVNHIKSKLGATYINASFVPLIDMGDHSRKPRFWDGYGSEFRMGLGPYIGYRIGSKSKLVYEADDDEKHKEKNHDSLHLNNLRYGVRLQLGFKSTDIFVNYDLSDLFVEDRGPNLNAISFGFIF
jgi:hypothetical protein